MARVDPNQLERVRIEAKVACKHMGPKAYAELIGVTVPRLRELQRVAGSTQVVRWSALSEPVLRSMFEAFISNNEIAARFCSRHGYSVTGFTKAMKEMWPEEWAMAVEDKRPDYANLYRIGRSLENRIRALLMAAGYFVVRSAGSKTAADLVAMRAGEILVVQCKRNGALPPEEWNALLDAAQQAGGIPVLVENPHAGTTNWHRLVSHKLGRGTGLKQPFPAPRELAGADIEAIRRTIDAEEATQDEDQGSEVLLAL